MKKVLVSLVSDQTIPNVLFINEQKGIDSYLFVSTKKMESKDTSQDIMRASNGPTKENTSIILVKEDSLQDIARRLIQKTNPEKETYIVNLTGGTKLMAIGAYDFFKKKTARFSMSP